MTSSIDSHLPLGIIKSLGRDFCKWLQDNLDRVKLLDQQIIRGTGSPQGVVTAPVGYLFLRSDGGTSTTLYVKETGTGNTGWVAK
jgi:hypothetical protein